VIESLDDGNRESLTQLNEILPRLHAAMTAVPSLEYGVYDPNVDLDQRFELFSRLHRLLGDLDGYWMEYDVTPDRQEMSGSLADDLTDIYLTEEWPEASGRKRRYGPHPGALANRILQTLGAARGGCRTASLRTFCAGSPVLKYPLVGATIRRIS